MGTVTLAATQMACSWDTAANLDRAEAMAREAAGRGANLVLLQELFETPYFCPEQKQEHFKLARPARGNPVIARFADLAKQLAVVLPVSFFERSGNAYFNSLAIIDADGTELGIYRKSHIPQAPGYEEKYYFSPGDTGFRAWETGFGTIGAGVCWDQWFPECARALVLRGAEILLYPTAIGSEPWDSTADSRDHWWRAMQGHAASNMVVVAASNRIGVEESDAATMTFYGSSFIAGATGEIVAEAGREDQAVITASFDLEEIRAQRAAWGLIRDRRPELYGPLLTLDGGDF